MNTGYQVIFDGSYTTVLIPTEDERGRPQMRTLKFVGRAVSEDLSPQRDVGPEQEEAA